LHDPEFGTALDRYAATEPIAALLDLAESVPGNGRARITSRAAEMAIRLADRQRRDGKTLDSVLEQRLRRLADRTALEPDAQ